LGAYDEIMERAKFLTALVRRAVFDAEKVGTSCDGVLQTETRFDAQSLKAVSNSRVLTIEQGLVEKI